jgi:hypothetical protein
MECSHGARTRREGVSAKGPWVGYFCPLKKGDPEQCAPIFGDDEKPTAKKSDPYNPPVQSDALIVAVKDLTAVMRDVYLCLNANLTAGERRAGELFNGPKSANRGNAIEVAPKTPTDNSNIDPSEIPWG